MSDQPWLTVITVVKDAPAELERTLTSMKDQDLVGVEHLVIDSSSNVDEVPSLLDAAGMQHSYSWVPAAGVYPAMNLGLDKACGRFIYYLNAGDEALPGAFAKVAAVTTRADASWVIGQIEVVSTTGAVVTTPAWDFTAEQRACFARGHFAPHQGTFARLEDLRAIGGFDTSYRIAADYAAFLSLSKRSEPVLLDEAIARFHEGGLSTQRWQESFKEFHNARRQILQPRGLPAVLELISTLRQFAAVGIYRGFWSKVVKR